MAKEKAPKADKAPEKTYSSQEKFAYYRDKADKSLADDKLTSAAWYLRKASKHRDDVRNGK